MEITTTSRCWRLGGYMYLSPYVSDQTRQSLKTQENIGVYAIDIKNKIRDV